MVRVLMAHEMTTGLETDSSSAGKAAHFIQTVEVEVNGRPIMNAQWGIAVAKNPYLEFTIKTGAAGDEIRISWVDNMGESRSDRAIVS